MFVCIFLCGCTSKEKDSAIDTADIDTAEAIDTAE